MTTTTSTTTVTVTDTGMVTVMDHGHGHHLPHVAVVPRPAADGTVLHSAVFSEVRQGSYQLYVRPDGPVQLTVDIHGGQVTEATWPSP